MFRSLRLCCALTCALMLGACGSGTIIDDVDTLWGEPSEKEKREAAERLAALEVKVPVQSIGKLEVGRTRDGILISAVGTAPGLGYALPVLRPRRDGRPGNDGFIEYDFVATQPSADLNLPAGTSRVREIDAYRAVPLRDLRGALGIRVVAASNAM